MAGLPQERTISRHTQIGCQREALGRLNQLAAVMGSDTILRLTDEHSKIIGVLVKPHVPDAIPVPSWNQLVLDVCGGLPLPRENQNKYMETLGIPGPKLR